MGIPVVSHNHAGGAKNLKLQIPCEADANELQ